MIYFDAKVQRFRDSSTGRFAKVGARLASLGDSRGSASPATGGGGGSPLAATQRAVSAADVGIDAPAAPAVVAPARPLAKAARRRGAQTPVLNPTAGGGFTPAGTITRADAAVEMFGAQGAAKKFAQAARRRGEVDRDAVRAAALALVDAPDRASAQAVADGLKGRQLDAVTQALGLTPVGHTVADRRKSLVEGAVGRALTSAAIQFTDLGSPYDPPERRAERRARLDAERDAFMARFRARKRAQVEAATAADAGSSAAPVDTLRDAFAARFPDRGRVGVTASGGTGEGLSGFDTARGFRRGPDGRWADSVEAGVAAVAGAVRRHERERGGPVGIARVRGELARLGMDRQQQDDALRAFARRGGNQLVPESNQKALSSEDRAAEVVMGNKRKHVLALHESSAESTVADAVAQAMRLSDSTGRPPPDPFQPHRDDPQAKMAGRIDDAFAEPGATGGRLGRLTSTETAVVQAYGSLRSPGDWVGLADLRDRLDAQGYSRADVDQALRDMLFRAPYESHEPSMRLIPLANRKALQPRDHEAALRIGDDDNHALSFGADVVRGAQSAPAPAAPRPRAAARMSAVDTPTPQRAALAPSAATAPPSTIPRRSARPLLENHWGTLGGEISYHEDGAIGTAVRRMGQDRHLEVEGDALANVLGRVATQAVIGRITAQQQVDRLKEIRDKLPPLSPARNKLVAAIADLDAPMTPVPEVPAATLQPLRQLMADLHAVPLVRRDSRETDRLAEILDDFAAGRTGGRRLIADLRSRLHNARHESVEGKFEIDRAVIKAIDGLEAMHAADRTALHPPARTPSAPAAPVRETPEAMSARINSGPAKRWERLSRSEQDRARRLRDKAYKAGLQVTVSQIAKGDLDEWDDAITAWVAAGRPGKA